VKGLSARLLALLMLGLALLGSAVLTSCGSSSSVPPPNQGALAGNWQFTLTKTTAPHTVTLISGFLQQTGKAVTGSVQFTPPISAPPCGGSFAVSGTSDGQNVNLTINEGGASVTLTGTASASSMGGSYNTVATGCGKSETGTFTAILVKPLNGTIQGVFHSTDTNGSNFNGADFQVTGQILQGDNVGSSFASVTGTLSAVNYPCFTSATLSGLITGTSIQLNIIGTNGATIGQIGALMPVAIRPDGSGFSGFGGGSGAGPYAVDKSSTCLNDPINNIMTSDLGNVCVDLGTGTQCRQSAVFSLNPLSFNPIQTGLGTSTQTVTLTNQSTNAIDLTGFGSISGVEYSADVSACGSALAAGASCSIPITFAPVAACPIFSPTDVPISSPLKCPQPRLASLPLTVPNDPDSPHTLLLTGFGFDAIVPNVPEINFGVVLAHTISPPTTMTFTNQGTASVLVQGLFTGSISNASVAPPQCNGLPICFVPCSDDPANLNGNGTGAQPCFFLTASQIVSSGQGATCQPSSQLQDTCTNQTLLPNTSCKVDTVFCPPAGTGVGTDTLYLQIMTNEHKADNSPTADATRVVVQLDGKSQ